MKKSKEVTMKTDLILCDCSSCDHQMLIHTFDEPDDYDKDRAYVSMHLTTYRSFWQRLKHGVKYIFGYKSRYGAWDEVVLGPQHADQLQKVVDHLRSEKEK